MPPTHIHNGIPIHPDHLEHNGPLLISDGRIRYAGNANDAPPEADQAEQIDAQGGFIAPGYVDIHVHGGDNADYMDGTVDAVRTANRAHARHGTTTIFPTTTTGSREQVRCMLENCIELRDSWSIADGARIAGVHFYGPYFAAEKVGCHLDSGRRDPDPQEYRDCFALDIVRIATCAAELPGAESFYHRGREQGYLLTCGHSNASWDEMAMAYAAGMRHVDHFWSAMSSVSSMKERFGSPAHGSMEQFVLAKAEMSTEVIADGEHLAPELLRFAWQMKGPERLCLVTDCNRALDQPPGRYRFGPEADGEWFESDGRVGFQPGRGLASSILGMDRMVRNMHRLADIPLPDAVRMASLTPAERCGIDAECGSLEYGKRADVLLLDRKLQVHSVRIGGELLA